MQPPQELKILATKDGPIDFEFAIDNIDDDNTIENDASSSIQPDAVPVTLESIKWNFG